MSPRQRSNHTLRRFVLYGCGALVTGGLVYGGFVREVDADYMTLLGSAQIHAEMASNVPLDNQEPEVRELRTKLITQCRDFLERAERSSPGAFDTAQMRAYVSFIEGDYEGAARRYRELREWPDVDERTRRQLDVREAKCLSNIGRLEEALTLVCTPEGARDDEEAIVATGLQVRILDRLGREDEAREVAAELAEASAVGSDGVRTAAMLLEDLGAWSLAEGAWRRSSTETAVRDYHLARLKLRSGESDNGLRLLQSSLASGHPEVTGLLRQEREFWETTSGRSLESLIDPDVAPAAPSGGR